MDTESFYKRVRRAFGRYEADREQVRKVIKSLDAHQKTSVSGVRALREIADVFEEIHQEQAGLLKALDDASDEGLRSEMAHIATIVGMLEHILKETDPETVAEAVAVLSEASRGKLSNALGAQNE